jgi:hypothetical protein
MKFILSSKNLLFSFFLTVVVFFINFIVPSQSNGFPTNGFNTSWKNTYQNKNSAAVFSSRYNNSEFRRRPFVLELQKYLLEKHDVPAQFSFNLLNYSFLFLVFLLLPLLAYKLGGHRDDGSYSQILFFLSLPILFAFFGSMCTYDDILQYLLIILFLISLWSENYFISFLFFLLSCICRETSFIYFFLIIAFFINKHGFTKRGVLIIGKWSSAIILYYLYLKIYLPANIISEAQDFLLEVRFLAWKNNFLDFKSFRESLTILFIMTGIYAYLLFLKGNTRSKEVRYWCLFSITFIIINVAIVSFSALIREARLLFLPLVFVIPFVQNEFKKALVSIPKRIKALGKTNLLAVFLFSFAIAFIWFTPKTQGTGYFYKTYAFFYITAFIMVIGKDREHLVEEYPAKNHQ